MLTSSVNLQRLQKVPIAIVMTLLGGCVASTGMMRTRDIEDHELFRETLAATHYVFCEESQAKWEFHHQIRNASIVWQNGKPLLFYEGIFREGIRSLMWPLKDNYALPKEGRTLGLKGVYNAVDFTLQQDKNRSTWTSYRYNPSSSERFEGMVEYLDPAEGSKLVQIPLPLQVGGTIQTIWLLPTEAKGVANVVVRYAQSKGKFGSEGTTIFQWFTVNALAAKGAARLKKQREYTDVIDHFNSVLFFPAEKSDEPVAVGIVTDAVNERSTSAKLQSRQTQIVTKRVFTPGSSRTILYTHPSSLSSFSAVPLGHSKIALAWLEDPRETVYPSVSYALADLTVQSNLLQPRTLALNYYPSNLTLYAGAGNESEVLLSWWANAETSSALVLAKPEIKSGIEMKGRAAFSTVALYARTMPGMLLASARGPANDWVLALGQVENSETPKAVTRAGVCIARPFSWKDAQK